MEINPLHETSVSSPLEEEGKQRWHIVRLICSYTGVLVVVYGVMFYFISGELLILIPALLFCGMFFGVKWFTSKGSYRQTGLLLQGVFCLVMLYYGIILGNVAQVQYLSIFMISISALLFRPDDKKYIYATAILPVVCLAFLELNYHVGFVNPLVFTYGQEQTFRLLILFVVILLNFILLSLHQTKMVGLLRKSRELFFQLSLTNQELRLQAEELERQVQRRTEELRELVAELQGANQQKTVYLQENNHEVRNPVNSICAFTERLLKHRRKPFLSLQEEIDLIEVIQSSSQHLRNVVTNALDYTRIEAGKDIRLFYETFDLGEWLRKSIRVYEVMSKERKITILLNIDASLPKVITTDKTRLTQIFYNLLGNSLKFTPRNKCIYINCWQHNGSFHMTIKDEGIGIPAESMKDIFNDYETNFHAGGVGLGLGIVKKLTGLLQGAVAVSSVEGEGSEFSIQIPISTPENATPVPELLAN